jgi:Ni/Co efflux regulator RcnB
VTFLFVFTTEKNNHFGIMLRHLVIIVFLSVFSVAPAIAQSQASKAQKETEKKQAALKKEEVKAQQAGLKAHLKSQDKETRKRMKKSKKKGGQGKQA